MMATLDHSIWFYEPFDFHEPMLFFVSLLFLFPSFFLLALDSQKRSLPISFQDASASRLERAGSRLWQVLQEGRHSRGSPRE